MQEQMIFPLLIIYAFHFLAFHPASHSTEALPHLPDGVSFWKPLTTHSFLHLLRSMQEEMGFPLYLLFTFILPFILPPTVLQPYHIFQTAYTLENRSQLTPLSTINYPCKNRSLLPFPHFCIPISSFTLPPTLRTATLPHLPNRSYPWKPFTAHESLFTNYDPTREGFTTRLPSLLQRALSPPSWSRGPESPVGRTSPTSAYKGGIS